MTIERTIFNNLLNNEDYGRKVIAFLKPEYFHNPAEELVFNLINEYVEKYNAFPTKEALQIDLSSKSGVGESLFEDTKKIITEIPGRSDDLSNQEWLLTTTEKFCQDKAIFNAIRQSIQIMDEDSKELSKGSIPQLLTEALAVSFDNSVGHDFFDDAESRFDFYHRKEERISFDLDLFNKITKGGIPRKSCTVILAPTGSGKSLTMCHFAAANILLGKNVLYITMEMSEEKIAERIDANLLDISLDDLAAVPKGSFIQKIDNLKTKTLGKLIIKEYPTSCAGANNFRYLLNELRIKKNFVPDVLYIDYLNICSSSRLKNNGNTNSYTYNKAIAEELRGLAVEFDVPLITATQTNRSGIDNSDIMLTDTSESMGIPHTADFMFALISTDELKGRNQIMIKQLKNRYSDPNFYEKFLIGVDKSKMRLYNLESSAQEQIVPSYNNDKVLERNNNVAPKFDKFNFDDFK